MQLNFTKVVLLSFSRKATSGSAKLSSAFTKSVSERMGWTGEVPDWQKSSTPAGKLIASQIALDPKDSTLSKHAMILDVNLVDGFEIVRTEAKGKKAKKTKSFKTELLFQVHFTDPAGARKLEQYMLTANQDSSMVVTYEKEPEQEDLPGVSDEEATGELESMVEEIGKKRRGRE